jgi:hypothetical protein
MTNNYWGSATHFRVPAQTIRDVEEILRTGQKIQAIKVVRSAAKCGLAEAKAVVERLQGIEPNGPQLLPHFDIKSITLVGAEGEMTVDLEGMQLMGLMQLQTLGLDECRRVLDLVALIEGWRNGVKSEDRKAAGYVDPA